jgi:hypothetical protein
MAAAQAVEVPVIAVARKSWCCARKNFQAFAGRCRKTLMAAYSSGE